MSFTQASLKASQHNNKENKMKLSNQAMGAIMMALQKSLIEQTDIVPVLESFEFDKAPETKRWGAKGGELVVQNPPTFTVNDTLGNTNGNN